MKFMGKRSVPLNTKLEINFLGHLVSQRDIWHLCKINVICQALYSDTKVHAPQAIGTKQNCTCKV